MNIESIFRLFSVAILGLAGFACVRVATPAASQNAEQGQETFTVNVNDAPAEFKAEIEALQEVKEINAGRFNPYVVETGGTGGLEKLPPAIN